MEKHELKQKCSAIVDLIGQTNNSNVYDNIVEFFQLTSELYDKLEEIQAIPVRQEDPSIWMRLFHRKEAEKVDKIIADQERQKRGLCQTVSHCGRSSYGYNRTNEGEKVTKENIFFGGIRGLNTLPIAKWEINKNIEPTIYNIIASQMTRFMKSHEQGFKLIDWF